MPFPANLAVLASKLPPKMGVSSDEFISEVTFGWLAERHTCNYRKGPQDLPRSGADFIFELITALASSRGMSRT